MTELECEAIVTIDKVTKTNYKVEAPRRYSSIFLRYLGSKIIEILAANEPCPTVQKTSSNKQYLAAPI